MSDSKSRSGFICSKVIQVHPTRRCNLTCIHCYSSSSPHENDEISPDTLIKKLSLLRDEGFDVVSFSGGEPLVYPTFLEIVQEIRKLGFRVNVITNGILLNQKWLTNLEGLLSRIGISIDGPPLLHDKYRGNGAFKRTKKAIQYLRDSNTAFGIAHCVTKESIDELPWMLDFCLENKASLLQLHPLVKTGRANDQCYNQSLGVTDRAKLFLIAEMLRLQSENDLQIQLDLLPAKDLLAHQSSYKILKDREIIKEPLLSELVNPVVLDEKGTLWPLSYGMDSSQCIAAGDNNTWEEKLNQYKSSYAKPLKHLLESAFQKLKLDEDDFVDWYAHVMNCSYHSAKPIHFIN